MGPQVQNRALFAFPFRPFFILCAVYGALSIALWVTAVTGIGNLLPGMPTPQWHAHEMLYGYVPAAIAGFLLTAMCNWTGARPLAGSGLIALVLLWLGGRLAMCLQGLVPYGLIATIDGAFLPALALYAGRILWRARSRRNYGLVLVLLALAIGNGLVHAATLYQRPALATTGLALGLDLIALLMAVVAGRITPAFSANWLRARSGRVPAPAPAWINRSAIASLALLALSDLLGAPAVVAGILALIAGLANGLRLICWAGWRTVREPLLWILHLAYAFIALALLLRAGLQFGLLHNPSLWHHSLGAGAIGILIPGVMARVSMGHTGRPLTLPPGGLLIFIGVVLAALLRLAVAAGWLPYSGGLQLSGLAWVAAYTLFVVLYSPVLWSPRPDGKPG